MAIDHRTGTKVSKHIRREDAPATRLEPYPYIGIVKNNLDPTKSGRLQVYIPDLGGDPDEPANWQTVSYASPFMGYTNQYETNPNKIPSTANKFENVTHTYGMWMVPPDIGVQVIVIFIAGDPLRGYFISCVNPNVSRHMLPGMAGSTNLATAGASDDVKKAIVAGQPYPTVEFNETNPELNLKSNLLRNPKPIHEQQFKILLKQGLDRDTFRGVITSSSQREAPSSVFGISTPGRPFNDLADDARFLEKVRNEEIPESEYEKRAKTRKGGHTFVLDDGDAFGNNELVRLRTARGHQILMHDSQNTLYISNADGTAWVELTNEGAVKVFTDGGFSVRSKGSINLRSDGSINMDAGGAIRMRSKTQHRVETGSTTFLQNSLAITSNGKIDLKAGGGFKLDVNSKISIRAGGKIALEGSQILQNSGGTDIVDAVDPLPTYNLPDTKLDTAVGAWVAVPQALNTICTVAPTHEPYPRGESPIVLQTEFSGVQPQATFVGSVDQIKQVTGTTVTDPAKDKHLRTQPTATQEIGPLNTDDLTAYYSQIGQSESSGDYASENSLGYVGKYQFGYQSLIDGGYVKSTVTSNDQLNDPNSWTGKDGVDNKDTWLSSETVQETAMEEYTKRNYTAMVKNGAITADMPKEEVGGMLSTAHLLGATGAKNWRAGQGGSDAFGTTGDQYFQKGKYAVAVLGPKMPDINAG